MPVAGRSRLEAGGRWLWRLSALPLLVLWLVPQEAWPSRLGGAVELFWALLPGLTCAGLAFGFARSLRRGQEPLIARYIRFDERRDPVECAGYARGLTWFWAVVLAVVAVVELGAVARGVDLGMVPDALLLGLFLGEHVVRSLYFPAGGIAWPLQTLRAIVRAERARHG
jgi:uncharacterized membrane protein